MLQCLGGLGTAIGVAAPTRPARATAAHFSAIGLRAALIGKIASFIDWPASAGLESGSSPFLVTVLDAAELARELRELFDRQPPQGHPARVRVVASPKSIEASHVLFISPSYQGDVSEVLSRCERSATLTIGNMAGLCARGVAVNLVESHQRIDFEVNRHALKRAGLRASYHLLSRAHLVDGP